MRRTRTVLSVLAAGVLALAACGDSDDTSVTDETVVVDERDGDTAAAAGDDTSVTDETVVVDERDGDTAAAAGDDTSVTDETVVVDERDGDTASGDADGTTGGQGAAAGAGAGGVGDDGAPETTVAPEAAGASDAGSAAGCIPGTYLIDSASFVAQIEDLGFDDVGAAATWEGGTYTSVFRPDGTYTSTRAGWTIRLASPDGALVATFDGDQTGTWSVDGGTMSVTETADDSSMSIAAEVDGQVIPMPAAPPGTGGGASISGSGPVSCDEAGMVVTIDGIVTDFERTG